MGEKREDETQTAHTLRLMREEIEAPLREEIARLREALEGLLSAVDGNPGALATADAVREAREALRG